MQLDELTTNQLAEHLKTRQSVIVPLGVLEAHGAHLPLGTDTFQAADAARRAAEICGAVVAPAIGYGMCRSALGHPGTLTVRGDTLRALIRDILVSLYDSGFRDAVLYSGHFSATQLASMEEAGYAAMEACPDLAVAVVAEFDLVKKHCGDLIEHAGDLHAGEVETSRILAIRPDLVRQPLPGPLERGSSRPLLTREPEKYWPHTTHGNARLATEQKGEQIGQRIGEQLAAIVVTMEGQRRSRADA